MPDVLIRDLSEPVLAALKQRAERHRRSLQQELVAILEAVSNERSPEAAAAAATAIRERLARSGRVFGDSAELLREDRDR